MVPAKHVTRSHGQNAAAIIVAMSALLPSLALAVLLEARHYAPAEGCDTVVIGECHDDPVAHALEAYVLVALSARRERTAVSLEMFEQVASITILSLSCTPSQPRARLGSHPGARSSR